VQNDIDRPVRVDRALIVIGAIFLGWTFVVLILTSSDLFLPPGFRFHVGPLDFARTGQFGDSFGVISAAMASAAGYFAYQTFRASQIEIASLRRSAGESTFLNLLERRFTLIENVRVGNNVRGSAAIDFIADGIRQGTQTGQSPSKMFEDYAKGDSVRGLRNVFRYTYHIVRFAEDLFGYDERAQGFRKRQNGAYPYVRLLRSQLSDNELLLIALNVLYDPDGGGFGVLLDRYALLDNMTQKDITLFTLEKAFQGDEFGLPHEGDV
jgi:hypothetical protein